MSEWGSLPMKIHLLRKNYFKKQINNWGFHCQTLCLKDPKMPCDRQKLLNPHCFSASAADLIRINQLNIKADFVAGHSLGEYSALYASGVLSFEDALSLVRVRGQAMQKAGNASQGAMAAILGLDGDKIDAICSTVPAGLGICQTANYNSLSQTVISGNKEAVAKAMDLLKEAGAIKTIPLNVSGAFHSSLMSNAANDLKLSLDKTRFLKASIPVITNIDGKQTINAEDFQEKLYKQVNHSVKWVQTMEELIRCDSSIFIEIGAGKVLSTLMKKFNRKSEVFNTDSFDAIDAKFASTPA